MAEPEVDPIAIFKAVKAGKTQETPASENKIENTPASTSGDPVEIFKAAKAGHNNAENSKENGGTSLSKSNEELFIKWWNSNPDVVAWKKDLKKEYGEEPSPDDKEYDYRGAFEAGIVPLPNKEDGGRRHWDSIGLNNKDLKAKNHPTRWKSEYMKVTGKNPDEKNISFEDAVIETPSIGEFNPNPNVKVEPIMEELYAKSRQDQSPEPAIKSELPKPNGFEYQAMQLGNSLVGAAIEYMAKFSPNTPMGQAELAAIGSGSKTIGESLREVSDTRIDRAKWVEGYEPNMAEEVLGFGISMLPDLPLFGAFGKVGQGSVKLVQGAAKKIAATIPGASAERIAVNSFLRAGGLGSKAVTGMSSAGSALGIHTSIMDIKNQLESGKSLDEVNYWQTVKEGGKMSLLGAGSSLVGVGAGMASKYASRVMESASPASRMITNAVIKSGGLAGEAGVFLYGGKAMGDDDAPITFKDFATTYMQFGLLKLGGVKGLLTDPMKEATQSDLYDRVRESGLTANEIESLGYKDIESIATDIYIKNPEIQNRLISDKVTATTKVKLFAAMSGESVKLPDLTKSANRVDHVIDADKSHTIKIFDKDGTLLESRSFDFDENLARDYELGAIDRIQLRQAGDVFNDFPSEYKKKAEDRLKQLGYSDGIKSMENDMAIAKHYRDRTKDESAKVESAKEIIFKINEDYRNDIELKSKDEIDRKNLERPIDRMSESEILNEREFYSNLGRELTKAEASRLSGLNAEVDKRQDSLAKEKEKAEKELSKLEKELPKEEDADARRVMKEDISKTKDSVDEISEKENILKNETEKLTESTEQMSDNKTDVVPENPESLQKKELDIKENGKTSQDQVNEPLKTDENGKEIEANAQTKGRQEVLSVEQKAKQLADVIRKAKFIQSMDDLSKLSSDPTAILKVAWDGSIEAAAKTIEAGGKVADAIINSLDHLRNSDWYKNLSDQSKKIAEDRLVSDINNEFSKANESIKFKESSVSVAPIGKDRAIDATYDVEIPASEIAKALSTYDFAQETSPSRTASLEVAKDEFKQGDFYKSLTKEQQDAAVDELANYVTSFDRDAEKTTRFRLPSEGDKIGRVDVMAALKDEIRLQVKAAGDAAKSTKKSFAELGVRIKEIMRDAMGISIPSVDEFRAEGSDLIKNKQKKEIKNKPIITDGQYKSIIRRLSLAGSDKKIDSLIEYVQDVVDGGKYKEQYQKAKGFVKELPAKDKTGKFGNYNSVVGDLRQIDLKQMTIEELADFNEMLPRLLSATPDLSTAQQLWIKYSGYTKEVMDVDKSNTFGGIMSSVEAIIDKIPAIESASDWLKAMRATERARIKLGEMEADGTITGTQRDLVVQMLGEQATALQKATGIFEEQMADAKRGIVDKIMNNRAGKDVLDGVSSAKFSPQINDAISKLLNTKRQDIESLNAVDIDAYNQVVDNLKVGGFTASALGVLNKIDSKRIQRVHLLPAFDNIMKKGKLQKEAKHGFTGKVTKFQQTIWATGELKEEYNLTRQLQSMSAVGIDYYVGSDIYKRGRFSESLNIVGKGINEYSKFIENIDPKKKAIVDSFMKGFKANSKLFKAGDRMDERIRLGMIAAELSWQADPNTKGSSLLHSILDANKDALDLKINSKTSMDRKISIYNGILDFARSVGAVKNHEGAEIIDAQKLEVEVRKEKRYADALDGMGSLFSELDPMAEMATLITGRGYVRQQKYFPFIRDGYGPEVSVNSLRDLIDSNVNSIRMEAGSTHTRKPVAQMLEFDVARVLDAHTKDIARNYYVLPNLKSSMMAMNEASKITAVKNQEKTKSTGKSSDLYASMLGRAMANTIKSRTALVLNGRWTGEASSTRKIIDKIIAGGQKKMLISLEKPIAEYFANVARATASGVNPNLSEYVGNYSRHKDVYDPIIESLIGTKYMSRFSHEMNENAFKGKISGLSEKAVTGIITFADDRVGRPVFSGVLNKQFMEISGKKFDPIQYKNSEKYRMEVADDLDVAASAALGRVEELFNAKAPLSRAERARFIGGYFKSDTGKTGTKIMNMLMGFNRNEFEHMGRSFGRLFSGDPTLKYIGLADLISIPTSNFAYMGLRATLGIGVKKIVNNVSGDEDDAALQQRIDNISDYQWWLAKGAGSGISLIMGGSSNIYAIAASIGMYSIDKVESINGPAKDYIEGVLSEHLYINKLEPYGSIKNMTGSLLPASSITSDMLQGLDAMGAVATTVFDARDRGYITDKELYQISNGFNLMLSYSVPNIFSGYLQKYFNTKISESSPGGKNITIKKYTPIGVKQNVFKPIDRYKQK